MKQNILPQLDSLDNKDRIGDKIDFESKKEIDSFVDEFFSKNNINEDEFYNLKTDFRSFLIRNKENLSSDEYFVFCEEVFRNIILKEDQSQGQGRIALNIAIESFFENSYPNPEDEYEENKSEIIKNNISYMSYKLLTETGIFKNIKDTENNENYDNPSIRLLQYLSREFSEKADDLSEGESSKIIKSFVENIDNMDGFNKEELGEVYIKDILVLDKNFSIKILTEKLRESESPEDKMVWSKYLTLLELDKNLESFPKLFKKVTFEYDRLTRGVEEESENLQRMYNEIFFERELDKNRASYAILEKAFSLLKGASDKLGTCKDNKNEEIIEGKEELIKKLIADLKREDIIQKKVINDLALKAEELNGMYSEIGFFIDGGDIYHENIGTRNADVLELAKKTFKESANYENIKGKVEKNIKKNKKYDSEKLIKAIENIKVKYGIFDRVFKNTEEAIHELEKKIVDAEKEYDKWRGLKFDTSSKEGEEEFLLYRELADKVNNLIDAKNRLEIGKRKQTEKKENDFYLRIVAYINRLEKLLSFQKNLEKKLDEIVYNKNSDENGTENEADSVFKKYQEIIDQAKSVSKIKIVKLLKEKRELSENELNAVVDSLIEGASQFLSKQVENINKGDDFPKNNVKDEIDKIDSKILLLSKIISQLSRDEVANLDLREIADIEKIEDLSSGELVKNKELFNKLSEVVGDLFPEGDREDFREECQNEKLDFTITMAGDEILSAYSRKELESGVVYLDWFVSNPEAPLKGLGEATSKLEFYNKGTENQEYYALAKPYVKSFPILIEKMGFVSFAGLTEDEEYKHHYSRCRLTPDDKNLMTKNLNEVDNKKLRQSLIDLCQEDSQVKNLAFNGEKLRVSRVNFQKLNHENDIKKEDKEGWLYREIEEQGEDNYILSRYIPLNNKKGNSIYYVVFEKSIKDTEEENSFYEKVVEPKYQRESLADDQEKLKRAANS